MKQDSFKYAEIVKGGLFHSNKKMCYIQDLDKINLTQFKGGTEIHISLFRFSQDFLNYYEQNKTISGYNGAIHTGKYLIADFDSSDLETVKQDVIMFLKYFQGYLQEINYLNNIPIFFTGNKGFNIYIPANLIGEIIPGLDLHIRVKNFFETITKIIYNETDYLITTLDNQIYTKTHLIRLPNTLNKKSGLYKIPLYYSELLEMNLNELKELAKSIREINYKDFNGVNNELREIFYRDYKKQELINETTIKSLNFKQVSKGERNKILFENANRLRYKNISKNEAEQILELWNNSLPEPLPKNEFKKTIESAYKYETKENINRISRNSFYNFEDRKNSYYKMLNDIKGKTIYTGYKIIDNKTRGIRPGEVCLLTSITGLGKSAITQNIIMNYCKENPNKTALYFSLEMGAEEIHEREIQISNNVSGFEVEHYKHTKGLNNFIVVTEPLRAELIPQYIDYCSNYFSETSFFVIDHSGLLDYQGNEEYQAITKAMRFIKQVSMKYKIPALVVSQINRLSAIKKDERISLFSAKSSGELENSSSIVLSLEKITNENYKLFNYEPDLINPDVINSYSNKGINLLCLTILKNRRGGTGQAILEMNKRSLIITESNLNPVNETFINENIF